MFSKFIGITQDVAALIEQRRERPDQSENDILAAALAPRDSAAREGGLDLGQGATLLSGERIYLFLSEGAKREKRPDGVAEARLDGIYVEGKRVKPSRGSSLQPAMEFWQRRKFPGHDGKLTSLSAWRQWHVERNGRLVPLLELKDPALAHRRRSLAGAELSLEDLGLG